ncbi:DNA sulfur modification protein DndB [Amphritea sp. 1_MG-2023]|uniref:DNA sulfur modification protein DndB n=1 Tax=Amphritea sp. 1_MG-2023 TaxID=3062670 RepID=UPI0026E1F22E|nr:DNA sulfur modification protein DndB [Amphritea sp. 1_MG-2023]MDO6562652.1 DNA sulfur modification protein DndB [Amphritea sp. 1_MG-2023]
MAKTLLKEYSHTFPAVRGVQAGRPCYTAMCPMRLIPKIFVFDEEEVPPELRAQRILNRSRIPEMANYLINNPQGYTLSAITASIDEQVHFEPMADTGPGVNLGMLTVPMDAQILINDGQHRRAAIEEAIKESHELGHDHIPVLFFVDEDLKRSQQMFADLNKYAVRPNDSLSTLYDHRDPSSDLARHVVANVECFRRLTEMDKSSLSNRSTKLFTLSSIKMANRSLLRKSAKDQVSDEEKTLATEFWTEVCKHIPDWNAAQHKQVSTSELRQNYVHSHGVTLQALGSAGADLLSQHQDKWQTHLKGLNDIDWSRSNVTIWEGRALMYGKLSKARANVALTANLIRQHIGVTLTAENLTLEEQFNAS